MNKIITQGIQKNNNKSIFFSHLTYGTRLKLARRHKYRASSFDVDLAHALDINPMWLRTGREEFEPDWLRIPAKGKNKLAIDFFYHFGNIYHNRLSFMLYLLLPGLTSRVFY